MNANEWPYVANIIIERHPYGWWKTKAYEVWMAIPAQRQKDTASRNGEADKAEA